MEQQAGTQMETSEQVPSATAPKWVSPMFTLVVAVASIFYFLRGGGLDGLIILGCLIWSGFGSFANKLYWIPWWACAGFITYGGVWILAILISS